MQEVDVAAAIGPDRPDAEIGGQRQDVFLGRGNDRGTGIENGAVHGGGQGPAADAVLRLEYDDSVDALSHQAVGRGQPGKARAYHDNVYIVRHRPTVRGLKAVGW